MKSQFTYLLLALGLACSASAYGRDVAEVIPADPLAVIICDDIKQLEADVRAFSQSTGTPIPPDLLENIPRFLTIEPDAWQRDRPIAAVLMDKEHWAAFLPVVADLKERFGQAGVPNRDGVYRFGFASAVVRDGYLIVSMSAEALEPFRNQPNSTWSATLSPQMKKARGDSDLFYWINLPKVRPLVAEGFVELERMASQVETRVLFDNIGDDPVAQEAPDNEFPPRRQIENEQIALPPEIQKFIDRQVAIIRLQAKAADYALSQGQECFGGLSISREDFQIVAEYTARPASPMAGWLQGHPKPHGQLLDRLPPSEPILAVGLDTEILRQPMTLAAQSLSADLDFQKLGIEFPADSAALMGEITKISEAQSIQLAVDVTRAMTVDCWSSFTNPDPAYGAIVALQQRAAKLINAQNTLMSLVRINDAQPIDDLKFEAYRLVIAEEPEEFARPAIDAFGTTSKVIAVKCDEGIITVLGRAAPAIRMMADPNGPRLIGKPRFKRAIQDLPGQMFAVILFDPTAPLRREADPLDIDLPVPQPLRLSLATMPDGIRAELDVSAASIHYTQVGIRKNAQRLFDRMSRELGPSPEAN